MRTTKGVHIDDQVSFFFPPIRSSKFSTSQPRLPHVKENRPCTFYYGKEEYYQQSKSFNNSLKPSINHHFRWSGDSLKINLGQSSHGSSVFHQGDEDPKWEDLMTMLVPVMVQTGGNETQHYVGVELKLIKGSGSSRVVLLRQNQVCCRCSFEEDVKGVLLLFVDLQKERNPYLPLWIEICDENCEHYEESRQAFLGMLQNGGEDGGCNFFKWCTDVGSGDSGRYVKSEGKKETLVIMYEGVDLVGLVFMCHNDDFSFNVSENGMIRYNVICKNVI
ncbi:hypothetical protein V8G54_028783 [Vigna mungo]|uniref:Uncharacterized protein n=1 Tax=Vigna mungo TaxID=3915 RepID=A0AAQ3MSN1_VIGMU